LVRLTSETRHAAANGALAEATIDSGAKPYFIAGGVIATIFFISVGAILIRKGNRYLRIVAAAAQWQARWY
jgi:hypothetical protein